MSKRIFTIISLFLTFAILLGACGSSAEPAAPTGGEKPA